MSIFSKKKPKEEMTSYSPQMEYPTPKEAVIDGIQRATEGFGGLIYNPEPQVPTQVSTPQQQIQPRMPPQATQMPQVRKIADQDIIEAFQEMEARIANVEARLFRRGL